VHQDGLVHVSALSEKFVKDPRDVVKAGQVVKVKVLEVDPQRQRIALTMRLTDEPGARGGRESARDGGPGRQERRDARSVQSRPAPQPAGAMAAAFAKLKR
jgi:uncharacterized protein